MVTWHKIETLSYCGVCHIARIASRGTLKWWCLWSESMFITNLYCLGLIGVYGQLVSVWSGGPMCREWCYRALLRTDDEFECRNLDEIGAFLTEYQN